jgi:hypothetical protein
MFSFEGCVEVLGVSEHTAAPSSRATSALSLDALDPSSNLRNLGRLFAAPATDDGSQQPAKKRRKVSAKDALPVQVERPEEAESIVLAKVSVELVGVVLIILL